MVLKKTKTSDSTIKKDIGVLKGTLNLLVNNYHYHGFMNDEVHEMLVDRLRTVGKYVYKLIDYEAEVNGKEEKVDKKAF